MAVLQAERRLEPLGVERDGGVLEPRLHLGEHLERLEVRGDDEPRTAIEERLEEGGAERRALGRIGARAELVEEDERAGPRDLQDLAHLAHERREGREVLGEALLVADHRQHLIRERDAASRRGRDVAARLGHEHEEPAGLERHGLAARVRAAEDQTGPVGRHAEVDRDDVAGSRRGAPPLGDQERMAGPPEVEVTARLHQRLGGVEPLGERGAGEDEVERAEALDEAFQRGEDRAHAVGQLGQDALLLVALGEREPRELVVERDRLLGLDEHRGAALRPVMDDSAHRAARVVADGNDVATVPQRDVPLLERRLHGGVIEQALDPGLEVGAERRDLAAERAEPGTRAVREAAVGIEGLVEGAREIGERGQGGPGRRERGRDGYDPVAVRAESDRRRERAAQLDERGPVEHRAGRRRLGQDRPGVTRAIPGWRAFGGQCATRFGRLG